VIDPIDPTEVEEALSAEIGKEVIPLVTAERVTQSATLTVGLNLIDPARGEGDAVFLGVRARDRAPEPASQVDVGLKGSRGGVHPSERVEIGPRIEVCIDEERPPGPAGHLDLHPALIE